MSLETLLLLAIGFLTANNAWQLRQQKNPQSSRGSKNVILDTCALIDGRIIEVARGGFTPSRLMVPKAVVHELQYMADQADPLRRERARYGLDVINELQQLKGVDVQILQSAPRGQTPVDELLIQLAKQHSAQLFTTDYNLQKVATVEGVEVLNINQLTHALRPRYLPGEKITIKLVQPGQNADQAVGYLDDGTMVVVEHAKRLLQQTVTATCTRMIQTEAGKMMFAVLEPKAMQGDSPKKKEPSVEKRLRADHKPKGDSAQLAKPRRRPFVKRSDTSY